MTMSKDLKRVLGLGAFLAIVSVIAFWRPLHIIVVGPENEKRAETKEVPEEFRERITLVACPIPAFVSQQAFATYEKQKQYQCMKLEYFGVGDGSKGVCRDSVFNLNKNNCNVLSFGINKDWSFDDAFGNFGCKVVSFDPTIGQKDHQRSENVTFLNLGISNKNEIVKMRGRSCQLDTYENILKRIGLLDSVIDYLKMDVELAELKFFEDVFANTPHLLKNIKQIGMETHYGGKGQRERFWVYYHLLACFGFKVMDARQYGGRTEIVWGRP